MTAKRKRSPRSINPITYWWNEFLFSRSIDFETRLMPDDCALRLRELREGRSGWINRKSVTAEVYTRGKAADFDVRIKRYNRGIPYTTVKAEGRLVRSDESETTLVNATIKFGWIYYAGWLMTLGVLAFIVTGVIPVSSSSKNSSAVCIALPMLGFIVIFYMFQLFSDRSTMENAIVDALDDAPRRKRA